MFCVLAHVGAVAGADAADRNPDHELGRPFVQAFSPKEYDGHSQVFASAFDSRGVFYAANSDGVLEYDGARWRRVVVPGTTFIYGLSIDADDVIYVGGIGQIGMIRDSATGEKEFVSLLGQLPPGQLPFREEVWEVSATPQGVFFGGMRQVYRWRDGRLDPVLGEPGGLIYDYWTGSRYFVQVMDQGLYQLDGDDLKLVSEDPVLRTQVICGILEMQGDAALIATKSDGLFVLESGTLRRFETEVDDFMRDEVMNKMIRLASGDLLLGTFNGGAVVVNAEGGFVRLLDESTGLPSQTIVHQTEDREGGVWLSLGSGLARVELASPITAFDRSNGLRSVLVWSMVRHESDFYLGTAGGLFRLRRPGTLPGRAAFELVPGMQGEATGMISFPEGLLVALNTDVKFIFNDGSIQDAATYDTLIYALERSRHDPSRVFVGHKSVGSVRFVDGAWVDEGEYAGLEAQVRSIVEEEDGAIWLGTAGQDAFRIEHSGVRQPGWWDDVTLTRFGEEAGISAGSWITISGDEGALLFYTDEALFTFDETASRFVPVDDPDPPAKTGGPWRWDQRALDGEGNAWGTVVPAGEIDFSFDVISGRQFRDAGGSLVWEDVPAGLFDSIGVPRAVLMEEAAGSKVLWVGGFQGVLRWDLAANPRGVAEAPLSVFLRRAGVAGENAAYDGGKTFPDDLAIAHTSHAVRFEYAAPVFSEGLRPWFQTRLEGYEAEWTPPGSETAREFTNLPEGDYAFHVRAGNALGQEAEARVFEFSVQPPWYRTFWSYGGYVLLSGLAVAGIVRWRVAAIRRENERLEQVIAERTEDLRVARDEANQANHAKSTFLANMSHELRTPLNGILGYSQILRRDRSMNAENRHRLDVLQTSGEHLLRLINEVLDLSKIEAGRIELHPASANLRSIVDAVSGAFRPRIEEKALGFAVEVDASLPSRVVIDEQKFSQVLFNLVGNAVKFTERGRVEMRLSALEDRMRVEIIDTGPGIAPEEQTLIFQPFQQAASRPLQADGTGLGLTICSRIVALMGGQLQVESEADQGSRFWFEIPVTAVAEAITVDARAAVVTGYSGRRRRVLVTDDVAVNRSIVVEMLTPLGFDVVEAPGGAECLAMVEELPPDLILLDLRMSPMHGAEVLRRLRLSEAGRSVRVVSFSASTIGFTREDARAMGCDDYLPKPFREEELLDVLQRQLELVWEEEDTAASRLRPDQGAVPDADEAAELLSFARRGDAMGLRTALRQLTESRPELGEFVEDLDRIASQYRMREIRERLETLSSSDHV